MNTDKQTVDALIEEAKVFVEQSHIGRTTARELDRAILLIRRLVAMVEHAPTVIERHDLIMPIYEEPENPLHVNPLATAKRNISER